MCIAKRSATAPVSREWCTARRKHDRGDAIRLAWDDEQVAEWFNRQMNRNDDAPMGTAGYRVDVRQPGEPTWNSLQQIASMGDLMLGPNNLGPFRVIPSLKWRPFKSPRTVPENYWMPPYFATWRGSSLALTDQDLANLHQHLDLE